MVRLHAAATVFVERALAPAPVASVAAVAFGVDEGHPFVDLGLDRTAGLKDIGDWVTRRVVEDAKEPEAVAATLDDCYQRSDPWFGVRIGELWSSGRTWRPVSYIRTGLDGLDVSQDRGVTVIGAAPSKTHRRAPAGGAGAGEDDRAIV